MIEVAAVDELLGRWWFNYDQGAFDEFASMLTEDVHFTCRTDTGTTDYEAFVRADYHGRDAVIDWQTQHRIESPYPLRHMGLNVHISDRRNGAIGEEASFASYLFVTHLPEGSVSNLSTAIVTGSARVELGVLRLSSLHVVLDTQPSVVFKDRP